MRTMNILYGGLFSVSPCSVVFSNSLYAWLERRQLRHGHVYANFYLFILRVRKEARWEIRLDISQFRFFALDNAAAVLVDET